MAHLTISLLGGLEARLEPGPPLAFRTQKAQALLAYLALPPGQAHRRDKLAALLWGEMRDEQARTSLRQALYDLRKTLGAATPGALRTEGETVALDPAAIDLDVLTFTRLIEEGSPAALERAATLYRGDLLEGLSVREEPFEAWLMEERERLRELAIESLAKLLSHQSKVGAVTAAIRTARRLLALDPLAEPVHRSLMRLQASLGQRAAALRHYQHCVNVLQRHLGVEPEAETKQLYQDVLRQRNLAANPSATGPASPGLPHLPRSGADARPVETPLVGRETPMTQLREALDQAWAGCGRLLAVVGEAGIGKSRLVDELVAQAAQRDGRILVGRAYESDQILLFGPFVDAFRAAQLAADREVIEALGPTWRAELARLLPEVAARDARPLPDRVDYRRLFECIAQLITRLGAREPLLLVLEDLHWADELSLRLLAFLGRRVLAERVLIVVTAREEELEDAPLLRRMLRDTGPVRSVSLSPLSQSETIALVRMLAPTREPATVARLSEQVWMASEGNPFVVVETVRGFQENTGSPAVALPQRVRDVIGGRLERLAEGSRSLLAVAAVIGRDFEFELLRQAAGLAEDAAAEAVEELVRRRLLTGVGERLDFTHERIRNVAYGELPPWRRKRLHHRIAETIEALYTDHLADFWETLADHYQRAEAWAKATRYYLDVARRARRCYAYSIAERSCGQAAAAAAKVPDDAGVERARALELLGDVVSLMGDLERANRSYQAALDVAPAETDRRRIVNKCHRPQFTCRDGARIAFYEHGSGDETLLFMNPIVYGLEIFQPVLEHLCQDFRIITMDARGTGRSDPIRSGYGTCDHAVDVEAVIQAAGGEPVTAIGISKSSSILVRLAIAAPALVKRLVLIGTLLEFWPNRPVAPVSEVDARFREALRAGDLERALPLFVATVVNDSDTGELAEQFTRNLLRLPRETVLNVWAPDPDVDIAPVLGQVKTPTLVLHGTQDPRVPVTSADYLADHLPDARLYLFEGCGHLPIFTATAEFCDVLRHFVATGMAPVEATR